MIEIKVNGYTSNSAPLIATLYAVLVLLTVYVIYIPKYGKLTGITFSTIITRANNSNISVNNM